MSCAPRQPAIISWFASRFAESPVHTGPTLGIRETRTPLAKTPGLYLLPAANYLPPSSPTNLAHSQDFANFCEPFPDENLITSLIRPVVFSALQLVGQILLAGDSIGLIVGVTVAFAVP